MLSAALQRHQVCFPSGHPYVARSLMRVGLACMALNDQTQARQHLAAAVALYERYFGRTHRHTILVARALGELQEW